MHRHERTLKSPRLKAKWRRRYNRNLRYIIDGLTKKRWEELMQKLGAEPPLRRSWTTFVEEWEREFKK